MSTPPIGGAASTAVGTSSGKTPVKVQEILSKTTEFFRTKNLENPRLEAEFLLAGAWNWDRIQLYLKFDQPLSEEEISKARDWVRRRSQGEPLAYIQGHKYFYKRKFQVSPAVLIPRPETELAVEWCLNQLKAKEETAASTELETKPADLPLCPPRRFPKRILDIGTGSGCLGLSLLSELASSEALLVDLSDEALKVAKGNASAHLLNDRARFALGDFKDVGLQLKKELDEGRMLPFDLIVANPPYLDRDDSRVEENVRKYEPHLALFANEQGFQKIKEWSQLAQGLLKKAGIILFEIGLDQHDQALQHFKEVGFSEVSTVLDYQGIQRFIVARNSDI